MNNKILIELYVAKLDKYYDVFIPCNKKVKNVLTLLVKAVNEMTNGDFPINYQVALINCQNGQIFNPENTLKELGLLNGSRLILI